MIDSEDKTDFFRQAANNFANSAILGRYTATVHIEGVSDINFWSQIFHHFYPQGKFRFIYYSKSSTGAFSSGSMHCLNYLPYLSKRFFVCIDSDNRYLQQENNINIKHCVFQTYTYSIENHYCYAPRLNYVSKKCTNTIKPLFNFKKFLLNYSNIIYDIFLWHHYFLNNHIEELEVIPFNNLISFRGKISRWQLSNNGEYLLHKIKQRVELKIDYLKNKYPDANLEPIKELTDSLGVTKYNVYLFIRGHNIFEFMSKIGQLCCDEIIIQNKKNSKKTNNIKPFSSELPGKLWFDNYNCMNKIKNDISNFYQNNK